MSFKLYLSSSSSSKSRLYTYQTGCDSSTSFTQRSHFWTVNSLCVRHTYHRTFISCLDHPDAAAVPGTAVTMLHFQHQARRLCGPDSARLDSNACPSLRLHLSRRASIHGLMHNGSESISNTTSVSAGRGRGSGSLDDEDSIPPEAQVFLDKKDLTLRQLLDMVERADLDLQPQYQRGLVWDTKMASRLVVTALESRVVPTVYLEEAADGRYRIMDGKQRLASLLTFIKGSTSIGNITWKHAPVKLDVKEDSCDMRWLGKHFKDLPGDRKRKLENYSLMCVIVGSKSDRDSVFSIYQDINTGAVGHTDQQNRKAAYHGSYIDLLEELAQYQDFLSIQQRKTPDSEKETDRELILRFFAMLRSADKYRTPLWKFLNAELKEYQNADVNEIARLQDLFKKTASTVWQIWGDAACRWPRTDEPSAKATSRKPPELQPSLWDATMVAVAQELATGNKRRQELTRSAGEIKQAYMELCSSNKELKGALDNRSRRNVLLRMDLMRQLLQQTVPVRTDRRNFPVAIKQQLWEQSMAASAGVLCGICNNPIHKFGDAEVDHKQPWSRGGLTSLENAQLVHRYCNRNKSNRVEVEYAEEATQFAELQTACIDP